MNVNGFVAEGFEPVQRAFEESFASNGEVGAAFAATLDGKPVVDLWGGIADPASSTPWREDTLQVVFSGTKGFVALCMLMLIERGQLDLDQPVARYWPEFGGAGKEGVLVRHVVSHQAGLPGFRERVSHEDLVDDRRMAALLAAQAPFWPPGEHVCYHGVTYGWLCGELVRRVDGRSIGTFFAEEVAGPLGLELWIGLPEEQESRVSVLAGSLAPAPEPVQGFEEAARLIAGNPPLFEGLPAHWNSRAYHAAEIPGAGAIGTARSIARLYGCLACGGELDGVRLLRPETIELGRTCLVAGNRRVLRLAARLRRRLRAAERRARLRPARGSVRPLRRRWLGARCVAGRARRVLLCDERAPRRHESLRCAARRPRRSAHGGRAMKGLAGKVAIVTGGASGIGAATARRLAAEGASVVVADIQDDLGRTVASEIGEAAIYRRCDVASLADWQALAEATLERFGRLDYVHNNAYADAVGPTHELAEADWQRVLDVCVKQVLLSVKTCIAHLIESRGAIVNTSSVHALVGNAHYAAYDAAKGAISSLTRTLAVEYGPEVRVNAVLPGGILTPAWDPYPVEAQEQLARQTCLGRIGSAEEIAGVVAFLFSDDASYITGQNVVVDGGWTITKA